LAVAAASLATFAAPAAASLAASAVALAASFAAPAAAVAASPVALAASAAASLVALPESSTFFPSVSAGPLPSSRLHPTPTSATAPASNPTSAIPRMPRVMTAPSRDRWVPAAICLPAPGCGRPWADHFRRIARRVPAVAVGFKRPRDGGPLLRGGFLDRPGAGRQARR